MTKPRVVFEDKWLLVVDKPAGMVVNRAETVEKGKSLQDWLEEYLGSELLKSSEPSEFARRSGIVHRLDKETSGVMVIAKTGEVFDDLQGQFKARQVRKRYQALVYGQLKPRAGVVRTPMGRSRTNREKFRVMAGGKMAETKYEVEDYFKDKAGREYTLVNLWPKTGRTHQIRVQLNYFGHPVVGDERYGGRKRVREDKSWCPRQFLQARKLGLRHPGTEEWLEFEVSLAGDLKKALSQLSKLS